MNRTAFFALVLLGVGFRLWMLTHYGLPAFDLPEERRTEYIAALETADAETKTDDLFYTDFWDRQLTALEPLIELIAEVLQESDGAD